MVRPGKQFEEIIRLFLKELDPFADIRFDCHVPDRDTGNPRQVDGWANFAPVGHPISVLISCKDHARPLDVGAIETFLGEIRSTRATTGIIYSRSGFTADAIVKGRANGVSCCKYFDHEPPERPTELLVDVYAAHPVYCLNVEPLGPDAPPELLWQDLLSRSVVVQGTRKRYGDLIGQFTAQLFVQSYNHHTADSDPLGPPSLCAHIDFPRSTYCPAFRLSCVLGWEWFKGAMDLLRMHGALNMTTQQFQGSLRSPAVPWNHTPGGSSWSRCLPPIQGDRVSVTMWAAATPTPVGIYSTFGPTRVFGGGPWSFNSPSAADVELALLQGVRVATQQMGLQFQMQFGKRPS